MRVNCTLPLWIPVAPRRDWVNDRSWRSWSNWYAPATPPAVCFRLCHSLQGVCRRSALPPPRLFCRWGNWGRETWWNTCEFSCHQAANLESDLLLSDSVACDSPSHHATLPGAAPCRRGTHTRQWPAGLSCPGEGKAPRPTGSCCPPLAEGLQCTPAERSGEGSVCTAPCLLALPSQPSLHGQKVYD